MTRAADVPADDPQALAERVVHAMMAKDAFSRWLGIEVLSVRPHAATMRMVVRDDMINGFGVCHGGEVVALFRGTVYDTGKPYFTDIE